MVRSSTQPTVRDMENSSSSSLSSSSTRVFSDEEAFNARFDDFFSHTTPRKPKPARTPARSSRSTQPSRVAAPQDSTTTLPPPYGTPEFPAPSYEAKQEPSTLTRYMFMYGFVFPIFWIVGTLVLFMKLKPVPEAECGKSCEQQMEELSILRNAELKWAKRCAMALAVFLVLLAGLITGLYFALLR